MDGGFREKLRAEQTKSVIRDRKSVSWSASGQPIHQPPAPLSLDYEPSAEVTTATYKSILDGTATGPTGAENVGFVNEVDAAAEGAFRAWQMEPHSLMAVGQDFQSSE